VFIEFLTSKFFFIVPMLVGAFTFSIIIRWVSLGTGITRSEAREEIKNGNQAMAIYFRGRIIGVAIVVAGCVLAGASV